MKDLNVIQLRLENNTGDKIIIVDNLMTVNHKSHRENYDLNLLQECEIHRMPSSLPIIVGNKEGELDLIIANRSKCIYFDDTDIDTINQLKNLFESFINPDLNLAAIPFNDSREKSNPKGFKSKKNQLDFYKVKTDNKKIIDTNTVAFDLSPNSRIIVIGNLIGLNNEDKSETYDMNKIIEYKNEGKKVKILFKYPKSNLVEKTINFDQADSILQKQFEDFLEYWSERNTF